MIEDKELEGKKPHILSHGDGGNSHYSITITGDGWPFLRITVIINLLFNY